MTAKGLADPAALITRKEAWTEAYRATPHGRPVELPRAPARPDGRWLLLALASAVAAYGLVQAMGQPFGGPQAGFAASAGLGTLLGMQGLEPDMPISRRNLLVVCVLASTTGDLASGQQAGRGDATSNISPLPYRLVEWPTPPTSAAGVPGAWNFIQVSSVAVTARGTVLVLHRGAHPILEFDSDGKLLRSWGDGLFSEGKVAPFRRRMDRRQVALFRRVRTGRMHGVRRPFGARRSAGQHLGDRCARPRRLQAEPRGQGDHAPRHQGQSPVPVPATSICRPTSRSRRTAISTSATDTAARAS